MIRKFVLLLAAFSVLTTIPACTSGDSKGEEEIIADDGTSEELAGLAGDDTSFSDDAGLALDGEQIAATTENMDSNIANTVTEDQLTIDSFGESTDMAASDMNDLAEPVPEPNSTFEPAPPPTADIAANELPTTTTDMAMGEPPTDMGSMGADEIAPPPTTMDDQAPEYRKESTVTDLDEPKPVRRSLQKVATEPWKIGSKWVNAIYFARPGDSLESISQTLYGDDRTTELKKINPTYNRRDVKPGDKIYYASPARPDDREKILTYFEEQNIPSLSYVSKSGDNIRTVSKDLLGYPEAWKEVWAYNTLESKQDMPEGTELRYWDASAHKGGTTQTPLADMAVKNKMPAPSEIPPMPEDAGMPPMDDSSMAQNELPPPPSPSELPPPPDMDSGMNMADLPPPPPPMDLPPPPPPPMETAPPPPPPPVAQGGMDDSSVAEQDQTLAMGAVAAAAIGFVALVMVRRKRKQKEMDQALGETHVG